MREILFRGKRVDNGEWVYGNLNYGTIKIKSIKGSYYISDFDVNPWDKKFYPIIPESVGQYTGLTDKNGRKIFEGDIVTIRDSAEGVLVEFIDGEYQCTNRIKYKYYRHPLEYYHDEPKYTVIGNIHDNPELLEEVSE